MTNSPFCEFSSCVEEQEFKIVLMEDLSLDNESGGQMKLIMEEDK